MSQPLLSPGPGGRCWSQWSLRRKSRRAQLQASSRDPGIRAAGRALRLAERGVHGHLCLGVRGVPLHPTHGSPRGKDEEEEGEGIPPSPFMTRGQSFCLSNAPATGGPHRVCVRIAEGVSNIGWSWCPGTKTCGTPQPVTLVPVQTESLPASPSSQVLPPLPLNGVPCGHALSHVAVAGVPLYTAPFSFPHANAVQI